MRQPGTNPYSGAPLPGPPNSPPPGRFGPPPSPPPGRRRVPGALLAVALVLALAGGGGVAWLLLGGDDGDTDTTVEDAPRDLEPAEGSLVLSESAPGVSPERSPLVARGAWFVDGALVRVVDSAVVSMDPGTGEELWRVNVERNTDRSQRECPVSANADENRIALLQGGHCEMLTVLDLTTGQELVTWPVELPAPPGPFDEPAIIGDTVALAGGSATGGAGYRISTGEQLWYANRYEDGCADVGYQVLDGELVARRGCGEQAVHDAGAGGSVRGLDEDGGESWAWEYTPEYEDGTLSVDGVLALEPLTVTASLGDGEGGVGDDAVLVVSDNLAAVSHRVDFDPERHADCAAPSVRCPVVSDGEGELLLVPTSTPGETGGELVAFDLTTGAPTWEAAPTEGHEELIPFLGPGDSLHAYQPSVGALPGALVALSVETGESRTVMRLDEDAAERETAMVRQTGVVTSRPVAPLWHPETATFALVSEEFSSREQGLPALLVYR
ncbi:PQQ-like domain-containing protein [Streptomyces zhaozhouensis]|uniref:PQQ-like domain-containing protein n=1 Tax=Streptomyces zhaozhouensis TaxID=1300267 RepID=A0A286DRV7_9ACTN|nr:PQQ-binding-like beta-propeller repeat protein [Streptomyces zhaozhouensis]SOD61406.1 PQQ-like domain-containing protein [Streptomyces zhaozhouensis]